MAGFDRSLKTTFGSVSQLYDSSRPNYPSELGDDVLTLSRIKDGGKILDVGCGSGKATVLFGGRGYDIMGIDISEEMIHIAEKNYFGFPDIRYVVGSFEENNFGDQLFDLIISAQAWHWVDPDVGYLIADKLLKNDGSLALFWNFQEYKKSRFLQDLQKIFVNNCPKYPLGNDTQQTEKRIERSGLFTAYSKTEYCWELDFSFNGYLNLMGSFSWVNDLAEGTKENVLEEVGKLLQSEKDPIRIPYRSTLLMVKKK